MIQKVESIKNIGNYEDYNASGDVSLNKMNFIYAENGAGKTTLARIIHSLSSGSGEILQQHRRIGATTPSIVSIKNEDGISFIYNGTRWNRTMGSIEVFDAHFVADNIYTGFQISSDHRKHLYKFVLGNTGVDIAKKIEKVKQLIDNKNIETTGFANQIQVLSKCEDIDKVCKLMPLIDIKNLIETKKKELVIAQNNDVILKQSTLPLLPANSFSLDAGDLKHILSISVDGIGKDYLDIVKSHLDELKFDGLENSPQWAYKGFQIISRNGKNECPFCKNPIEGIKLIEGYNQYFSEKYINAVREAKVLKERLSSINIELLISQITNANKQVEELNYFWVNYVTTEVEKPIFDYDLSKLRSRIQSLKEAVERKYANPIEEASTVIVDECIAEIHTLSEKIRAINEYIVLYNTKILELRAKIRKVEDITEELNELELNKARFETPLAKCCFLYELTNNQLKRLQKINKSFQAAQKAESNQVFEQYGQKINHYLRDIFNTKFQISEIKDGGIRGRAKEANLEYVLTFNETPIEQEGVGNTSFKNILSEGDKNTIAFSFFLAKVTTDADFADKIIVFDDPLTSLDLNRRNATIHQLVTLQQQCKQVIVLSHNLHFLVELYSMKLINKRDKKVLQIINAAGKSSIEEYSIKKDWIDNYQKSLEAMDCFLANPSSNANEKKEEAINAIRLSLETFLKLKYCKYITNPDQTFGQIIHELETSACKFVNSDKNAVIGKLNQLLQISWRTHHGSIEEIEIYSEVAVSIVEAQQYVTMTLDLLYKEL